MRAHVGLLPIRILATGSTSVYTRRRNCRVVTPSETKAAAWIVVRASIGLFFMAWQRPSIKRGQFVAGSRGIGRLSLWSRALGGPLTYYGGSCALKAGFGLP